MNTKPTMLGAYLEIEIGGSRAGSWHATAQTSTADLGNTAVGLFHAVRRQVQEWKYDPRIGMPRLASIKVIASLVVDQENHKQWDVAAQSPNVSIPHLISTSVNELVSDAANWCRGTGRQSIYDAAGKDAG